MKTKLIRILNAIGKTTELCHGLDDDSILVLPHGGRVLGLFSSDNDENFLWTNPALFRRESAQALFESDNWHNSGGDRTWLSPEVDFFFPDYPDLSSYLQPRSLDPGNYLVIRDGEKVRLINWLALRHARSQQTLELQITKEISPALNPLRNEPEFRKLTGVSYAGYIQQTSLLYGEPKKDDLPPVGVWHLLQMPHGGELFVPTYQKAEVKVYFGMISEKDVTIEEHITRYRMRAEGEHKLGIRGLATTGRIGYLFQKSNQYSLIIRSFFVNPSGEYIDVPWNDQDDLGYALQACNINSQLGSFSELENHAPGIGGVSGQTSCTETTLTWAYRGTLQAIQVLGRSLLGFNTFT